MKYLGTQPAGTTRTGQRFKELQARVRERTFGRSRGPMYRQASGGTVIDFTAGNGSSGTEQSMVPRWG